MSDFVERRDPRSRTRSTDALGLRNGARYIVLCIVAVCGFMAGVGWSNLTMVKACIAVLAGINVGVDQ